LQNWSNLGFRPIWDTTFIYEGESMVECVTDNTDLKRVEYMG